MLLGELLAESRACLLRDPTDEGEDRARRLIGRFLSGHEVPPGVRHRIEELLLDVAYRGWRR